MVHHYIFDFDHFLGNFHDFLLLWWWLGHFVLWSHEMNRSAPIVLLSPWYAESGDNCNLSLAIHMNGMQNAKFNVIVETLNKTWVLLESLGDSNRKSVNSPMAFPRTIIKLAVSRRPSFSLSDGCFFLLLANGRNPLLWMSRTTTRFW